MCVVRLSSQGMVLQVEAADRPLKVLWRGEALFTPAQVIVPRGQKVPELVLEDVATGTRVGVRLAVR
jgi:hypothetical protein